MLKNIIVPLAVAVLAVPQMACQTSSTEADVDAITATGQEFAAVITANDLDGMVGFYTSDALLMPPNEMTVRGTEDIRAWLRNLVDRFTTEEFSTSQEEVVVAGDWAFRRATFNWTLSPKEGGERLQLSSKVLQIWERQRDGSWKIARGIWNSNNPPPGIE